MDVLLEKHGTKLMELKPSSVVFAASVDLMAKEENAAERLRAKREERPPDIRSYLFHGRHVKRAKDEADLLRIALEDRKRGLDSSRQVTRLIYSDEDLLRRSAEIAEAK